MTPLDDDSFYDEDGSLTSQNAMTPKFHRWAILRPETPLDEIFPDGVVPIVSTAPIRPKGSRSPLCYIVDAEQLTESQITGLAEFLERNSSVPLSIEEAIGIARSGFPIITTNFVGVGTTNHGVATALPSDMMPSSKPQSKPQGFGQPRPKRSKRKKP